MTTTAPERTTRRPTGLPSWPIGLLTGAEKTGKTYRAAEASASELVGGAYWLGIGEDDPDEYGAIPGARFEIVNHAGTYRDFLAAVEWTVSQPPLEQGKPNLIVLDSATRLWDLICADLQNEANARDRRKAAKYHRAPAEDDVQITMDLWNLGKQRWAHVIDTLRGHRGPVLITARLDVVTVMDASGQPTKDKDSKVKAEKSLPFDVGFTVEFPEPGSAVVTGVRSLRVRAQGSTRQPFPNFTVDALWRALGLADTVGERAHSHAGHQVPDREVLAAAVARADSDAELRRIWRTAGEHGMLDLPADEHGTPLRQLIEARLASLSVIAEAEAETKAAGGEAA